MRVLVDDLHQGPELAPAAGVLEPGRNRFPFALFDRGNRQIGGLEVRLYVSRGLDETARGPYVARYHPIEVKPQFRSQNSVEDPDSARSIYVAETPFPSARQLRGDRGREAERQAGRGPHAGDGRATATCPGRGTVRSGCTLRRWHRSGGDVDKIETRVPPDTMHDVDLADALDRNRPIVLLFATPALCESRICGPVTDVTEQVKSEFDGDAEFIHMEIYNDNDLKKGAAAAVPRVAPEQGAGAVHDRARRARRGPDPGSLLGRRAARGGAQGDPLSGYERGVVAAVVAVLAIALVLDRQSDPGSADGAASRRRTSRASQSASSGCAG